MFFPPDDCQAEQKLIPNSKFRVVDSLWAHFRHVLHDQVRP
jgi:homoserine O-acetyltransferase